MAEATEACDGADFAGQSCAALGCTGGALVCTAGCEVDSSGCTGCPVCDNDGVCESGEDCTSCPADCASGSAAACGNGICEAADGENCMNCSDCRGRHGGKPGNRYCCGDGGGTGPVGCADARCNTDTWQCTSAPGAASRCGDATCEGAESSQNCVIDCPAPICGDGTCNGSETECDCAADCGSPAAEICNDGQDNDCDGVADCSDTDCASSPACNCSPLGAGCSTASDCCSFKCKGKSGGKTCK